MSELILNEFDLMPTKIEETKRLIEENSQINETKKAKDCIFKFMKRYSDFLVMIS